MFKTITYTNIPTYKTLLKQIAHLQIIIGFTMMTPGLIALIYQEWYSLAGFILSGLVVSDIGYLILKVLGKTKEPEQKHAMAIAALGWIMVIVFGGLPFYIIAHITPVDVMQAFVPPGFEYESSLMNFQNPLHCIFESTSAYTTTGFTMAYHEPSIGKSLLFYRSFANFIGGAGFIIMALAVFRQLPGQGAVMLYSSEFSGEKLKASVISTAKAIWKVYAGITLLMALYLIVGTYFILPDYPLSENIFDAFNHAMSGQATGGFSTLDDSIAGYKSPAMDVLFLLPMFFGALSFPFFFKLVQTRDIRLFWTDIQTRAILLACIFGSAILAFMLVRANDVPNPVREGVFQFVSALSTTGWQTSNVSIWDDTSVLFITFAAMVVGGAAGATVGGIKVIRALILQKGLRWQINKVFLSKNTIKTVSFNGKRMMPEEMNSELARAGLYTLIYIILLFISTLFSIHYMGPGFTMGDAVFESASAMGTVGLSNGITDPGMSPVLETVYIIQMLAGRLEIIPLMVLLRILFFGTRSRMI
ncbi:MAG: TrkH family potassium uptake protein [Bacteroidetes bacterium]|nr:TrkH family potassium uptake protein [Bacteroidota bacterium]